jgi:Flp pilus assembly protein TadG
MALHRWSRTRCKGLVAVEMAMVAPILILMLFGIVEFGVMFHSQMQLNNMAREAARVAAIGAQPSEVLARLESSGSLDADLINVTMDYRTYSGGVWGSWHTLAAGTYNNNAVSGAEVRVQATYDYHLTVGSLFSFAVDRPSERVQTLRMSSVMRRE